MDGTTPLLVVGPAVGSFSMERASGRIGGRRFVRLERIVVAPEWRVDGGGRFPMSDR